MKPLLLAALLAVTAGGCIKINHNARIYSHTTQRTATSGTGANAEFWRFRYASRDGLALLESERLVLVFHDFSATQRKIFRFGDSELQVGGDGRSSVTASCRRNLHHIRFHSSYADGTNSIEFGDEVIRLSDGGRRIEAGRRTFELGELPMVIHLAHGDATVEEAPAALRAP